jgi:hypothetical protein
MKYWGLVGLALVAWSALSWWQTGWFGTASPAATKARRLELAKVREGDAFRLRLRSGQSERFTPPGLRAAYLSWKWLELLQATHQAESYDGDFSWFFSSLDYIGENAHESEILTLTGLGAFFFVIGKDHAGANLFADRLVARAPERYNVNFWSGFHALENLQSNLMAAYFFDRAHKANGPVYLKDLSERLKNRSTQSDEKIDGTKMLPEPLKQILDNKKPGHS